MVTTIKVILARKYCVMSEMCLLCFLGLVPNNTDSGLVLSKIVRMFKLTYANK